MADSDDDYDRRKGRDKFRRERNDYDRREERRRESWEDRSRQNVRSREIWNNSRNARERREMYGREQYDTRRRERFSPARHEMPQHQVKRMRRDWDDAYQHYDMPYNGGRGGGGPSHMQMPGAGGPHPGWGRGAAHDMGGNMPPQEFGASGPSRNEPDYPTQPPLLTFKQFLTQQDDTISEEEAIRKYNEYKIDFKRQQISEFFLAHKEEEWFKSKYHPEEFAKRQEEIRSSLQNRMSVFLELFTTGRLDNVYVDVDKSEDILKVLDAAVIKLEGGRDFDLTILDEPPEKEEAVRSRQASETIPQEKSPEKEKRDEVDKKKDEKEKEDISTPEKTQEKPLEMPITAEQEELQKKAKEYQQLQEERTNEQQKRRGKRKKTSREKSEYSYETESQSESASDSDMEPAPPGISETGVEDEPLPPGTEKATNSKTASSANGETEGKEKTAKKEKKAAEADGEDEKDINTKPEEEEDLSKPRPLHRTNSIFLRNLAPTITKQEVEAMCKRYPGFMRVALQDPQPERRFFRRGWVTFSKNVNIKDICWNLNNIRLRDCELGATLNRELKQRVRPVNGLTVHKAVARNDIKLAARIIQNLDRKWFLWNDKNEEKKDEEKEMSFSFVSKNPVLKNITDYLVEEGSYEEEELLGQSEEGDKREPSSEFAVDRDDGMLKVLDRMILYLRIVHSIDYYSANEYPNEDEMPHRCGIMHARGMPPGPTSKLTQSDVTEWMNNFETKLKPFLEMTNKIGEEEAVKLGKKNPEAEVEKFVQANTQELAKDKWLCPLSGKKFKGPDFVRKHIFNKHGEKVEEVKKEVAYFNNYLMDPKRPCLPEHPVNRTSGPNPSGQFGAVGGPMGGMPSQPPVSMMGFGQRSPHIMYGGNDSDYDASGNMPPYGAPGYGGRNMRDLGRRTNTGGRPFGRRSDPRPIIEYRDLDAPEEMDIF